eukprot:380984-Pyramimonas_sp.AAC.3
MCSAAAAVVPGRGAGRGGGRGQVRRAGEPPLLRAAAVLLGRAAHHRRAAGALRDHGGVRRAGRNGPRAAARGGPPAPPGAVRAGRTFVIMCAQDEFARALLVDHLVRVLRTASDLEILEAVSYSIQQLLRVCDIKAVPGAAAKGKQEDARPGEIGPTCEPNKMMLTHSPACKPP